MTHGGKAGARRTNERTNGTERGIVDDEREARATVRRRDNKSNNGEGAIRLSPTLDTDRGTLMEFETIGRSGQETRVGFNNVLH